MVPKVYFQYHRFYRFQHLVHRAGYDCFLNNLLILYFGMSIFSYGCMVDFTNLLLFHHWKNFPYKYLNIEIVVMMGHANFLTGPKCHIPLTTGSVKHPQVKHASLISQYSEIMATRNQQTCLFSFLGLSWVFNTSTFFSQASRERKFGSSWSMESWNSEGLILLRNVSFPCKM